MEEIVVTSQKELDDLPLDYNGRIYIKFGTPFDRALVKHRYKYPVIALENSSVEAWENSSVVAWDNSSVEARENSSVVAWENSSVMARGNSSVEARENSFVVARENSYVVAQENSYVVAWGNVQVTDATYTHNIKTSGNARIVYNPRTAEEYAAHVGADTDGHVTRLYKAVHKKNGRFFSDHDEDFEYVIGREAAADSLDTSQVNDCGHGIHAAHKSWCVNHGRDWPDLAILEVEMDMDGLVVPLNGSEKVRAAKCRVIREVPLEECGLLGKILAKRR